MNNIAIFASGSGTNAENIICTFKNDNSINISLICSNNDKAFVLERAKNHSIPSFVFSRTDFKNSTTILNKLKEYNIDFIVLAGFLWLIPEYLIQAFPNKIVNIHPALLPKYGGKGMYGMNVHKAVVENGETESGITIHFVNENYDEGKTIFQAKCALTKDDTPESVAKKIHELEYEHFPAVIKSVLK